MFVCLFVVCVCVLDLALCYLPSYVDSSCLSLETNAIPHLYTILHPSKTTIKRQQIPAAMGGLEVVAETMTLAVEASKAEPRTVHGSLFWSMQGWHRPLPRVAAVEVEVEVEDMEDMEEDAEGGEDVEEDAEDMEEDEEDKEDKKEVEDMEEDEEDKEEDVEEDTEEAVEVEVDVQEDAKEKEAEEEDMEKDPQVDLEAEKNNELARMIFAARRQLWARADEACFCCLLFVYLCVCFCCWFFIC